MPNGRVIAYLFLLALVAGAAIALMVLDPGVLSPDELARWLQTQGGWAPLVVIGLMVLHCLVPFPAELLALCAGAVFGVVYGSVMVWTGAMIGATISFALSRWLGRGVLDSLLSERHVQTLDRWSVDQGALTLLVCRFVPVVAFNLINYGAGLTPVKWRTFLWTTAIGILPITVLTVWLGSRMRHLDWQQLLIVSIAGMCAVVVGHAVLNRLRHRS